MQHKSPYRALEITSVSDTPSLPIVHAEPVAEPEHQSVAPAPIIAQADSDHELLDIWVCRHASAHTRRNYARRAVRLLAFVKRPLATIRIKDVQAYLATLKPPATRANATAALKSLFSFAQETGYLPLNVGAAVKAPSVKNTLAERILDEAESARARPGASAPQPGAPDPALRRRAADLGGCGLRWRDSSPATRAGQVDGLRQGRQDPGRPALARDLALLDGMRGPAVPDDAVFRSRKGGGLLEPGAPGRQSRGGSRGALARGLGSLAPTCPRQPRLDRGAPVHLVQATLGHASVATTGRYLHARPTDSSARYLGV